MTNIISCAPLAAGWNTFSAKTVVFSQKNVISSASSASYSNISSGLFILANHTVSLDNRRSRGPKLGAHAPTTSQPRETVNGCQVRDLPNMHNCQELSSLAASASLQLGVSVLRRLTKLWTNLRLWSLQDVTIAKWTFGLCQWKCLLGRFDNEWTIDYPTW